MVKKIMSEQINLQAIEKQTWKLHTRDGFADIYMGVLMLIVAVAYLTELPLLLILPMIAAAVIFTLKKYITTPRIGKFKFGPYRKKRELQYAVIATGIILIIIPLGLYSRTHLQIEVEAVLFIIAMVAIFSLMAYHLEYPLLLFYGALMMISLVISEVIGNPWGPITAFISGVVILIIGLLILIDFLDKHPVIKKELPDEGF